MPPANQIVPSTSDFVRVLADMFRRARWQVHVQRSSGDVGAHLIVEGGGREYFVELKRSPEARRDRLIPLLSQVILQIRATAKEFPKAAVPVAVVAAEHVPESVAEQVKQFAARYAPETGVGIIDMHGFRTFAGHGLEVFDARPPRPSRRSPAPPKRIPSLFSDLNQWMLKILLGQRISESLLAVPRAQFRNASQLAKAASVSLMSASRFVRQLRNEGFLDDREDELQLVRLEDLLTRWVAANQQTVQDIPVRSIIKREQSQLIEAVKACAPEPGADTRRRSGHHSGPLGRKLPRCAVGLFAAADVLGFGFVHGVPAHIYLERFDLDMIRKLGLSPEDAAHRADAYVRIPAGAETVFRAAVRRDGLPVSDILQVWLDVSGHPVRGREQAEEIKKRALGRLFGKS